MFGSSIRIAEVKGIRIGVHYTWFVIFALLLFSLTVLFSDLYPAFDRAQLVLTALGATLLFFLSIVLHELGHSLVAIARGIPVHSITLFIFGGVAQSEDEAPDARTEFWIAIAGPLVSFGLAALFYLFSIPMRGLTDLGTTAFEWLATINLIVGIFNLVPGFPLDGGRVFRAAVWAVTGNAVKGMRWAVRSGKIVAFGLMAIGVFIFFQTGLLINALWLIAIGWFLMAAAEASGTQFMLRRAMNGVLARRLMRADVPHVSGGVSVEEWVDDHVLATGQRAYLITDDGAVIGLATMSDAKKVPREAWASTPLREVMTPLRDLRTVTPTTPVVDVLGIMERHSLNQVPVVEDNARIAGWIDRDRLLRVLQAHSEARQ